MKILITILLFFVCVEVMHAQNPKIDSLNKLIGKSIIDTQRINLINKKIAAFSEINIDSAISMGKKNIEAAQKINYKEGEATARVRLANNYCFKGEFETAR